MHILEQNPTSHSTDEYRILASKKFSPESSRLHHSSTNNTTRSQSTKIITLERNCSKQNHIIFTYTKSKKNKNM